VDERLPRFWDIFFEVFETLPRQGPGNRACAERALSFCRELPPEPAVLDLGCGVGGQTLQLASLTAGSIVAVDNHAPFVERLERTVAERGLSPRVRPIVGEMASLDLPPESFDLVWSEGALYFIGLEKALGLCHTLLRPGGYLAFTDAVWLREDPPAEVRAAFEPFSSTMGLAADTLPLIERAGLELVGHFTLPHESWWDDFYTPMLARLEELRRRYASDSEALAAIDELAEEPDLHRRCSAFYGYEFYVARRPGDRAK
jgi:SAM-dependent methyltransferase